MRYVGVIRSMRKDAHTEGYYPWWYWWWRWIVVAVLVYLILRTLLLVP